MNRFIKTLVVSLIVAISLASCGKKGPPKPLGEDSQYPKQYPKQK